MCVENFYLKNKIFKSNTYEPKHEYFNLSHNYKFFLTIRSLKMLPYCQDICISSYPDPLLYLFPSATYTEF